MKASLRSSTQKTPNLLDVIDRGAAVRRHRHWVDTKTVAPILLIVAVCLCALYVAVMLLANRQDWHNIGRAAAALAAVPAMAGLMLITMRSNQFPITSSAIVGAVMLIFITAFLSAARVPISYTALMVASPVAIVGIAAAGLRLQRRRFGKVALLKFDGAEVIRDNLDANIAIVAEDTADFPFETVLIDPEAHHTADWSQYLVRLYMLGISIMPWTQYAETHLGRVDIESFDLGHMAYTPSQIYYSKAKRLLDIAAVIILAPLALVLSAIVALYIFMLDGSPALFTQARRGYGGSTFTLYKFRTMYKGTSGGSTRADDDRILPGCKLLRQFRLDELPQLLNILLGDMSWIGPRPVSVEIAQELEAQLPQYVNRQLVLPGLTGWAQVTNGYAATQEEEITKLSFDLYYIKHISFDLDLIILIKTVRTVLWRVGSR